MIRLLGKIIFIVAISLYYTFLIKSTGVDCDE